MIQFKIDTFQFCLMYVSFPALSVKRRFVVLFCTLPYVLFVRSQAAEVEGKLKTFKATARNYLPTQHAFHNK